MNNSTIKKLLLTILGIDNSLLYFQSYLANGDKSTWEKFFTWSFSLANIHSLEKKEKINDMCFFNNIWENYEAVLDLCSYNPKIRHSQQSVLVHYSTIREIILDFLKENIDSDKIGLLEIELKNESLESYYLLQTLKEDLLTLDAS